MTQRNKLNWKVRPFLAPINLPTQPLCLCCEHTMTRRLIVNQPQRFFLPLLVELHAAAPIPHHESRPLKKRCFGRSRSFPGPFYFTLFLQKLFAPLNVGHPHKMFRFPSPSVSWRWVGRSGKKKNEGTHDCILNLTFSLQDIIRW